jgi:hypothetical protein
MDIFNFIIRESCFLVSAIISEPGWEINIHSKLE